MESHGTAVRIGYYLLALLDEGRRAQRLTYASAGDVEHAMRVYDVVSAARLASRSMAAAERERSARHGRTGLR